MHRKGIVDMADININMQMDEQLKMQADKLFSDLGLNMASAVNLFVRQAVREQQIPFVISKEVDVAEMLEAASAKAYSTGIHKV